MEPVCIEIGCSVTDGSFGAVVLVVEDGFLSIGGSFESSNDRASQRFVGRPQWLYSRLRFYLTTLLSNFPSETAVEIRVHKSGVIMVAAIIVLVPVKQI